MTNIISIYNLSKAFDGKKLFQNFNFTVKKNSVHALIGANGAGKTTLLRLLTGLYEPDEGKISVSGKHAMLLENDYLYEDKTGLENLKIFGLYFGYYVKDYKKYSDSLNITEHLLKRVSTYSKGMKRKLSILIVILINSEIIYLDEPTSGVDPLSRVEIRKIIQKLKEEGKTILITSHDLSEIEKSADYVTMIENGKVVFNEDIDNIKGTTLEELLLMPLLGITIYKIGSPDVAQILDFFTFTLLSSIIINAVILVIRDMNKYKGISLRISVFYFFILIIESMFYSWSNNFILTVIIKYVISLCVSVFVLRMATKERIVMAYY